jgi:hypothetical protein
VGGTGHDRVPSQDFVLSLGYSTIKIDLCKKNPGKCITLTLFPVGYINLNRAVKLIDL